MNATGPAEIASGLGLVLAGAAVLALAFGLVLLGLWFAVGRTNRLLARQNALLERVLRALERRRDGGPEGGGPAGGDPV